MTLLPKSKVKNWLVDAKIGAVLANLVSIRVFFPVKASSSNSLVIIRVATLNGFLPTRATFSVDLLFTSLWAINIALFVSIYLVRRGRFVAHKRMQIAITILLLITVILFEVDVRFLTDWKELASPSPYYDSGWVSRILIVHLCFAVPTPILWSVVIVMALRRFSLPPQPGEHSTTHRRIGWSAVLMMIATSVTGFVFYWMAFVAE